MRTVKLCARAFKEWNLSWKKMFFKNFLGTDFVAPKSGHRREKQPVVGPDNYCCTNFVT